MLSISAVVVFLLVVTAADVVVVRAVAIDNECGSIVDLSHGYDDASPAWPNTQPFTFTKRIAGVHNTTNSWYAMNEFCMGEHGGTHLDAPYHFRRDGWKVSQIPLERLVNKGVFVNLQRQTEEHGANTLLRRGDLEEWERHNNAQIPQEAIVLVRFAWSKHYKNNKYYYGESAAAPANSSGSGLDANLTFPGISVEAADYLVHRNVSGVGVDTGSVDPGISQTFDTHRILAENNIYGMENLNLPPCLPSRGFTVIALPMNIVEGTGGPLRIIALINRNL